MTAPEGTYEFDESDLLTPDDAIPEDGPLFVINNSRSNKKLEFGDERVTLTAPGTRGSIQPISRDMLRSTGVLALWTANDIQISTSVKAQRQAVSAAVEKAQARRAHEMKVQSIVDASQTINQTTDDSKVTDVSNLFHKMIPDSDRTRPEGVPYTVSAEANTDLL